LERVYVPGVEHQGFLTDRVGAYPEGKPNVRVVEIVRRGDAHTMNPLFIIMSAPQFLGVPIEALKFCKKTCTRKITVHYTDSIMGIHGSNEIVTRIFNSFHVARCYVAGSSKESKVIHG
jgi:hypothetical protein